MTLDYIWIHNFRVLKEVGFNISSRKSFTYDKQTKTLKIEPKNSSLVSFFGNNISEVTAFIGENGVGKSTLFEFIIRNLATLNYYQSSTICHDGDFFAVFSNFILLKNTNLISNKKELEELGYHFFDYGINSDSSVFIRKFDPYKNLTYVYYSNIFDYKDIFDRPDNLSDVSTNTLLINETADSEGKSMFFYFVFAEIKRQIECITENNLNLPFVLPHELYIEISENVYLYRHLITGKSLTEIGLGNIAEYCRMPLPTQLNERFKKTLFRNIIKYRGYNSPDLYKNMTINELDDIYNNDFSSLSELKPEQHDEFLLIKKVVDALRRLTNDQSFFERNKHPGNEEKVIYFIYQLKEDNDLLYEFVDSVNKLMNMDTFIYYSWRPISSGEKAFLSFLARINYAKKMMLSQKVEEVIKDVILIIDEFDLYLHPEWQRVFFNTLIMQLSIIFPDKKIQLLISSHSPFLVSDLPRGNVILLKKKRSRYLC